MARVRRIAVRVEIEEDDGTVRVNEVSGTPTGPKSIEIAPHHRTTLSRSTGLVGFSELVEVGVTLSAVLVDDGETTLFREFDLDPEPQAIESQAIVLPVER